MKVVVIADDGSQQEVTEGVRVMYDCIVGSMDWGSGFLSIEEAEQIVEVARLCGFKQIDEAKDQLKAYRRARFEYAYRTFRIGEVVQVSSLDDDWPGRVGTIGWLSPEGVLSSHIPGGHHLWVQFPDGEGGEYEPWMLDEVKGEPVSSDTS